MKRIHTLLLEILLNYFPYAKAVEIADNAIVFDLDNLRFNLWDHIVDHYAEKDAEAIADECIDNLKYI